MEILHVASECEPFCQTGGLGDVVGALPRAQARAGHAVTVVLPGYRSALERAPRGRSEATLRVDVPGTRFRVEPVHVEHEGVKILFLRCDELFDRRGLYGVEGHDYADNAIRFAVFARAAAQLALERTRRPDVLHGHDWQAGLAIALVSLGRHRAPPSTVFTIHNLAYQGRHDRDLFPWTGLPESAFSPDGIEFYGDLSFLKAGVAYADGLTTVSPTYAREIQTSDAGRGLDGLLRARAPRLSGILNGIDAVSWDPANDRGLARPFDRDDILGRTRCREALEDELGFTRDAAAPIVGCVARLDPQKGVDLLIEAAPELLGDGARLVVLGAGAPELERALQEVAQRFPGRVAIRTAFDVALSRRIYAGSDLIVVPSRFEPCGLSQLYALRYGALPVVRRTGGLADTVNDADANPTHGTGFVFDRPTGAALLETIRRALRARRDPTRFREIQRRAMSRDDSWDAPAREYVRLYGSLDHRLSAPPPS